MADLTLMELVQLAHEFNSAAQSIIGQDEDLVNKARASLSSMEDTLKALESELPEPNEAEQAAEKLLDDASAQFQEAQIKEMLRGMGAKGKVNTPFGAFDLDAPDAPLPDESALEAAESILAAYDDKTAPVALKFEEALATVFSGLLKPEEIENIFEGFDGRDEYSAGFDKHNAPVLSSIFAPRP
jgi:hypothetical protein